MGAEGGREAGGTRRADGSAETLEDQVDVNRWKREERVEGGLCKWRSKGSGCRDRL